MGSYNLKFEESKHLYMNILNNNENLLGNIMRKNTHCTEQSREDKPRLIFQFPAKSMQDEVIKSEIKNILSSALKEQIGKVTS